MSLNNHHLNQHTESCHHPQKSLVFLYGSVFYDCPLPQPISSLLSITVISFAYSIILFNGITQYILFHHWLFLVSMLWDSFAAYIGGSFFFFAKQYCTTWVHQSLKKSVYLSGTLGMFPFGGSFDKGNNVLSCTVVGDVYLDKCLQVEYL